MSRSGANKIKAYSEQLKKVEARLVDLKEEQHSVRLEIDSNTKRKKNLKDKITSLQKQQRKSIVSDHAIVRYFERVLEMDIEDIRAEILKETAHRCIVKDNVVTTVVK